MRWDVHGAYILLDLLEDTSGVSLASFIKVKAAAGLHEYWWTDEPMLQNWVIGSAYGNNMKFMPMSETTLLAASTLKKNCYVFINVSLLKPSPPFYDGEFAVVIHNTMMMFFISCKDVSLYRFPLPPGISYDTVLSLGCIHCKSRHLVQFLTISSLLAFMLTL